MPPKKNDTTMEEKTENLIRDVAAIQQEVAFENGYNRLVVGSCTSRLASHVLTSTVKGRGYSLSADIQHVDARWKVPIVLPLTDSVWQEITRLCHLDSLKTIELGRHPGYGINDLVSSFVALLQEENPSRDCTIVRTAAKLTPFHFNKVPETEDSSVPLATQRRLKKFNLKYVGCGRQKLRSPLCFFAVQVVGFKYLHKIDHLLSVSVHIYHIIISHDFSSDA